MESVFYIQLFNILWDVFLIFQGIKPLMDGTYIFSTIAGVLVDFRSESLELFLVLNGHFQVSFLGLYFFYVLILILQKLPKSPSRASFVNGWFECALFEYFFLLLLFNLPDFLLLSLLLFSHLFPDVFLFSLKLFDSMNFLIFGLLKVKFNIFDGLVIQLYSFSA